MLRKFKQLGTSSIIMILRSGSYLKVKKSKYDDKSKDAFETMKKSIFKFLNFDFNKKNTAVSTPQTFLFSAGTEEFQKRWAVSILNWNKHCWEDTIYLMNPSELAGVKLTDTEKVSEISDKETVLSMSQALN